MIATLEFGQHLLVRLGAFLLRADEQEPEDGKHENEGQELHQHVRAGRRGTSLGRTHGICDGMEQGVPPEGDVWQRRHNASAVFTQR